MADIETEEMAFKAERAAESQAVIAEILGTLEKPAEEIAAADVQRDPEQKEVIPAEKAPEPEAKEPDENARGLLRLMEREEAVRKQETAFEERRTGLEKRLEEMEGKLEAASKKEPDFKAIRKKLLTDPVAFIEKELGIPPEQVTRLVIAHKLGDAAPAELRQALRDAQIDIEQTENRAEIARLRRELSLDKARPQAEDYLVKGESKYPTLAVALTKNKAKTTEALWQKVVAEIGDGEPNEKVYEKAVASLEKEWSLFRDIFGGSTVAPVTDEARKSEEAAKTEQPAPKETKDKKRIAPPKKYWVNQDDQSYVDEVMRDVVAIAKGQKKAS